jgi:hypothetical protein
VEKRADPVPRAKNGSIYMSAAHENTITITRIQEDTYP